MPVRNLPRDLIGTRLLHVSDPQVGDAWLDHVFSVIAELSPEIVVDTGDLVSTHTDLANHAHA